MCFLVLFYIFKILFCLAVWVFAFICFNLSVYLRGGGGECVELDEWVGGKDLSMVGEGEAMIRITNTIFFQ